MQRQTWHSAAKWQRNTMTKEKFLTARWNNRFSLGLGLVFFSFIGVAVFTAALPAGDAFRGLVLIGCLF
jgi:hypothetical protein